MNNNETLYQIKRVNKKLIMQVQTFKEAVLLMDMVLPKM